MSSSLARRMRRANKKSSERHLAVLGDFLGKFYTLLERTPKPSDDEVREAFVTYERRWKGYCKANKLTDEASSMFNREVSLSWQNRYAAPTNPTEI